MRKIKSLALIALTSFAIAACSSGNKEVEQASVDDLYAKGAAALQEGSYSDSIRYLKAATERFPGSTYQEQAMLDLIYANYKTQDYTATLVTVDNYLHQFPQSPNRDYAVYMAGLTNLATADNMIQDFFGIDRATRETTSMKTAFSNFQSLVRAFPNSPYSQDAVARMAYIKDSLARHELEIAKFYAKRDAWVAVSNHCSGYVTTISGCKSDLRRLILNERSLRENGFTTISKSNSTSYRCE